MALSIQGPDVVEFFTWEERLRKGTQAEKDFYKLMRNDYGLTVLQTGQHRDLPQNALARHWPDLFLPELAVFVQVKNGIRAEKYSTVICEISSYEACRQARALGNIVWIVWQYTEGIFWGNQVEDLLVVSEISPEARQRGSGTRAWRIAKSHLVPLDRLVSSRLYELGRL